MILDHRGRPFDVAPLARFGFMPTRPVAPTARKTESKYPADAIAFIELPPDEEEAEQCRK